MRSRTTRLAVVTVALIALAAGAASVLSLERQLASRNANVRAFDVRAREASEGFSDLRIAEQAYVAAGQGVVSWMPKVTQTLNATAKAIATLQQSATSIGARSALDEADAAQAEFVDIDKRARGFLASGQPFMAGDVIFAEGHRAAATAIAQIEAARAAEHQAFDATDTALRGRQALALAASGAVAALSILLLGLTGAESSQGEAEQESPITLRAKDSDESLMRTVAPPIRPTSPVLSAAARLCADFGRVRTLGDLTAILARGADVMDATGLVVWLGNATGADLQPVFAHGYSQQMLARMSPVVRSSSNAAATAYRTAELQIVPAGPDSPRGAIVAPIVSADGCIGAFSAEIRNGGEGSESVQALASILAAQLAGLLAPPASEAQNKTA